MIQSTLYKGYPSYCIENEILRVVVIPSHGAHIASLYDKRMSHEWLYQTPDDRFVPSMHGDCFTDGECAGLDEMFPNAAAVTLNGIELPDHGEGWTLQYQIASMDNSSICLTADGKSLPYRMEKRIEIYGSTLRTQYRVQNLSESKIPFMFAAHPLFQAEEDAMIETEGDPRSIQILFSEGLPLQEGQICSFPIAKTGHGVIDFRKAVAKPDTYCKYVYPCNKGYGRCSIRNSVLKRTLVVDFDESALPYVGIWLDNGACGKRKQCNVAIEPSTHLSVFLTEDNSNHIPAGGEQQWSISYTSDYL